MKKIFIAVLAVAALVSCSKEQTVNVDEGFKIGFDNTFVENSTRANDLKVGNFDFGVYGSVINSQNQQGMIFTNQEVANDGSYSPAQYWIAGANYEFVAIAPYTEAAWTYAPAVNTAAENGTITFNNETAVANQDLIFANATAYTDDAFMADPDKVGFTFNHMLSRVKFEFTNGTVAANNLTFKVTNVVLEGVHSEGTLAVADGAVADTWTVGAETFDKVFGNAGDAAIAAAAKASTEHFYLIPATKQFTVKFKVTLFQAGVEFGTYDRTATVTLNMQKGMSYNVTAELDADTTLDDILKPIEFQVDGVEDWENFTNEEGTLN